MDARALLREDSEISATAKADRAQWADAHPTTLQVVDNCFTLINQNEKIKKKFEPNYTQAYVGFLDGNRSRVFVTFWPRALGSSIEVVTGEDPDPWVSRLKEQGMNAKTLSPEKLRVLVTNSDLVSQPKKEILAELLLKAIDSYLSA